jgi:hypothetical protein
MKAILLASVLCKIVDRAASPSSILGRLLRRMRTVLTELICSPTSVIILCTWG